MAAVRQPTFFISHGGGPWPWIPEMKIQFTRTVNWLSGLPKTLPEKPKAILSVSGHWEESEFTVSTAKMPPMIYDYGGFPEHTYQIKYPAQGSPEFAKEVRALLTKAGIQNQEDPGHGFDHGTFVPLYLMYPNADIPVLSLSMKSNYDPQEHLDMGRALQPLRDQGVLIVGSGLSYHNMRGFRTPGADSVSKQFGKWLADTVVTPNPKDRDQRLLHWEDAPAARLAHPREDHLIPLMVVAGAAGEDPGYDEFTDHVMGVDMASYRFA
jgi:aromatic ring-opening dioxygenase catalytic subunit (LigB family)